MKKSIMIIAGLMILTNVLLSFLVEAYNTVAMIQGCAVALIGVIMLLFVANTKMKDAFRYSLTTLFSFVTIGEWFASFFAPNELANNWFVILALVILAFEVILLVASNSITNINSNK